MVAAVSIQLSLFGTTQPTHSIEVLVMDPAVLRFAVSRVIPAGLIIGAGMETFMNYTGFCKIEVRQLKQSLIVFR